MAVENGNVLSLLLAYSASHRARLLQHPEPANRIALWVQDIFPSLRHALEDFSQSNTRISDANLATAIMLSSLEIISPSTFGISIPWQSHLNIARQIIQAQYSAPQSISRNDSVAYFLSRWFAYLDVVGSLSGRGNELPLFSGDYWAHSGNDSEEHYVVDCLLGMTPRCLYLLAQVGSLARQCDNERISSHTGFADPDWQPSPSVRARAEVLLEDLNEALNHDNKPCPHRHSSIDSVHNSPISTSSSPKITKGSPQQPNDTPTKLALEILTSNVTFHLAAMIHLRRRILFEPRASPTIQALVGKLVSNFRKIRHGGNAEACILFSIFTAGCEALEEETKNYILERIHGIEGAGMMQVSKAKKLMERVWEESQIAEGLAGQEHLGNDNIDDADNTETGNGSEQDEQKSPNNIDSGPVPIPPSPRTPRVLTNPSNTSAKTKIKRRAELGWEELLVGGEFFG